MRKPEIEVCAYSLESCTAAREAGADRVELCGGMYEGGTTPSMGFLFMAREILKEQELFVMVRPRGGDFLYSEQEFQEMCREIALIRETGADGIVIGLLKADGSIDSVRTAELVERAFPMQVTFHRAFDMARDYREALEAVIGAGCCRILTAGQRNTAPEGREVIAELVRRARKRIGIMAGSGVNAENALALAATGVDALHMSGKSVRDSGMTYRNPAVSMGGVPGLAEYEIAFTDKEKVKKVIALFED